MSPLECSECFGDQLLHRTYTWQLTLHSRPNYTRKRDTRSESLEIPINVVLPQSHLRPPWKTRAMQPEGLKCRMEESNAERGTAEPIPRLYNLYSIPRCAQQAALPRLSRRMASQHSYPLNRFSSVPLDPMERPMSQADLELDYNPPRVQLSDEMFVFQDGRWVNENCRLQSPYFSPSASFHHKLHHKRMAKECMLQEENKSLREENKSLREENKALREENRMLRNENKILQVFWEEHKASLGREESRAPSPLLHKDSTSLEVVKKDHVALQVPCGKEDSTLQLLREENRALQQLLEKKQAYWAQAEDMAAPAEESKPALSPHEEPCSPGLLQDQGSGLSSPFEEPKGPPARQEDSKELGALREMVSNMSGLSGEEEAKAGRGLPDGCQPLQLLREMRQALQALLNENWLLQEENRTLQVLRAEHRGFQENKALWENNKLKLQQKLVIDTVTEVTARMEMLIEELYAFMPARSQDPKKPSRV
ncbi:protein chibby homolog 2 isoform X2 [Symphalangus syndactylus]|uniref:protein chibby homolog 2 isoform X2 n=2 Tax=Symphalangus syndactylus TaxID=9590 RepID=UPI002442A036|nr:protein chibby homolog 2 isoform X2 [Symphalangus syndactylus]